LSGAGDGRMPPGSGEKWKVNRAVRASNLPAYQRLIMLVLSDIAKVGTAELPPGKNPSTAQLARETGIKSLTTVREHRQALEEDGWIKFTPPTLEQRVRHKPGTYKLSVPASVRQQMTLDALDSAVERESADDPRDGQEMALGPESDGQQMTRATVRKWPSRGSANDPLSTNDLNDQNNQDSAAAERQDIQRLCDRLADLVAADGSTRPPITQAWRRAAHLMLDRDGRTEKQIRDAIDYAHADPFWCTAVLSMPSLRRNYTALQKTAARARQLAEAGPKRPTPVPPAFTPDVPDQPAPPDVVTAAAAEARARIAENRTAVHAADAARQSTNTNPDHNEGH
jgi:DNA-binding transcriptional regulator YhcF (GntR family)